MNTDLSVRRENIPVEKPDTMHGRLLESVDISGYSLGRAINAFEHLLEEDRWKTVGDGYEDINDFIETIDFSAFKISPKQRKKITKKLTGLQVTQRAAAKMLGVDHKTIGRDLRGGENSPKQEKMPEEKQEGIREGGENSPKPAPEPSPIADVNDDDVTNVTEPALEAELEPEITNEHFRTSFTGDNEWYTPVKYIESAREVMGEIDLDPATSEYGQSKIKAVTYYTKDNDGLEAPWNGRVWLNPPYSQPDIANFINKLIDEIENGDVLEAIVLTNNYTDTAWFHSLVSISSHLCFTRGRIKFEKETGPVTAPTQGSAFFYYGPNSNKFEEIFKEHGFICKL